LFKSINLKSTLVILFTKYFILKKNNVESLQSKDNVGSIVDVSNIPLILKPVLLYSV